MNRLLLCAVVFLAAGSGHAQWLQNQVDTVVTQSNTLIDRTSGLKTRTENILTEAQYAASSTRSGLTAMSSELREAVRYSLYDLTNTLIANREGLYTFLGVPAPVLDPAVPIMDFTPPLGVNTECGPSTPCEAFRGELVDLILTMIELDQALVPPYLDDTVSLDSSPEALAAMIDIVPGRALYPLYRGMVEELDLFDRGLNIALQESVVALNFFWDETTELVDPPTEGAFYDRQYAANSCAAIFNSYEDAITARATLSVSGPALKLTGKTLMALGATVLKEPGVSGGYAGGGDVEVHIKSNWLRSLGSLIDGFADGIASASTAVGQRMESCASLSAQLAILANQQQILEQQQAVLDGQQNILDGQQAVLNALATHDGGVEEVGGCDSSGGGAGPFGALAVLGLLVRRRRPRD